MTVDPIEPVTVEIGTSDDFTLVASRFEPERSIRLALLVNSAMGVKRRFYDDFAAWMSARGVAVLTYDYSGIGDSSPEALRGFETDVQTWGGRDQTAVFRWLRDRYPEASVFVLGHSIGGQITGLSGDVTEGADGIVLVAAQSGYWGHWRGVMKPAMWLLWHVFIPALTPLLGRFPARLFGLGEDLPAGVALQWARWGRHPEYLRGPHDDTRSRHHHFRVPVRLYAPIGDVFAPASSAEAILDWFEEARTECVWIDPTETPEGRFGHFDWFRQETGVPYWRDALDWMLRHAG